MLAFQSICRLERAVGAGRDVGEDAGGARFG